MRVTPGGVRRTRAPRRRSRLAAVGLAAALAAAAASPARADAVAIVARAGADPPVAPAAVARALARAVTDAGRTPVADPVRRARERLDAGAVPAARLAAFRRARERAAAGWRAYTAVELTRAAELLAAARRDAASVLDLPGGTTLYADIALRRGVVELHRGNDAAARSAFALAAALDPDREVSIMEFHPDAVAAYEAARAPPGPGVRVRIDLAPPGARVEVNGTPAAALTAGPAPAGALWIELPAGEHVVVARAPGHHASGLAVDVPAAGPVAVEVRLRPAPAAAALRSPDAALSPGLAPGPAADVLAGITRYGDADAVAIVAPVWSGGGPALLGQVCRARTGDASGGAIACTRVVEIRFPPGSSAAAAADLWSALARAELTRRPDLLSEPRLARPEPRPAAMSQAVPRDRGGGARCHLCRNPWLWVGVGAAVLAAGGATWLLARDAPAPPAVTVDPCEFVACPGGGL